MGSYEIAWKRSAEQDLRRIDRQHIGLIMEAVEGSSADPFATGSRKLQGSESAYRIRVGDYRIVYSVEMESHSLVVVRVRHRKDVYRG